MIRCFPLSTENWKDFRELFGPHGACAGCWCMYWRVKRKIWEEGKGDGNREKMKNLVKNKTFTGLIAYLNNTAVGWCSLSPRENYPVLNHSRILAKVDDQPVWSIVCFYMDKNFRKKGWSYEFLEQIKEFAKKNGIKVLEGYPVIPNKKNYPAVFAFTGFHNTFLKAGFKEVLRRSPTRPIMRFYL